MNEYADKLPPQDRDAEMACLGAMMMGREAVGAALSIIPVDRSEWFYDPRHAKLYETLAAMYARNEPIDLMTASHALRCANTFDMIGGHEYMLQLADSFADTANTTHYARIVRDKGVRRDAIRRANVLTRALFDAQLDVTQETLSACLDLQRIVESGEHRPVCARDDMLAFLNERRDGALATVPTTLPAFDAAIGGFPLGALTVLAARTSAGKSSLGMQVAMQLSAQDVPTLFVSVEMGRDQLNCRGIATVADVPTLTVMQPHADEVDWIGHRIFTSPLAQRVYWAYGLRRIPEIVAACKSMVVTRGVRLLVIDHLHEIDVPGRDERRHKLDAAVASFKALAQHTGAAVLLLAQLNRSASDEEPKLHHLRECGAIEERADLVLMAWGKEVELRDKYKPDVPMVVKVEKNRNGPLTQVRMIFHKSRFTFEEQR